MSFDFINGQVIEVTTPSTTPVFVSEPSAPSGVVVLPVEGPRGPQGPPGGSEYVHVQVTPASVWIMPHGLGRYPNITIITNEKGRILTDIEDSDLNNCSLVFSSPKSGKAICV